MASLDSNPVTDNLQEIQALAEKIAFQDDAVAALKLLRTLGAATGQPAKELQEVLAVLRWIALPLLSQKEVMETFRLHLAAAFSIPEFQLWEKTRAALTAVAFVEERDEMKQEIRDSLVQSQVSLTAKKLLNGEVPTVGNWIREYVSSVGNGRVDAIQQNQFFTKNKNVQVLAPALRERVRQFFLFWERLKLSSQRLEGFEETIPVQDGDRHGFIRDGKITYSTPAEEKEIEQLSRIAEKVTTAAYGTPQLNTEDKDEVEKDGDSEDIQQLKTLAAQYPEGSLERRAIEEEINKLQGKSNK